ncbi:MAG: hypothetical protein ABFC21_05415, partial [Rectinema sp.]
MKKASNEISSLAFSAQLNSWYEISSSIGLELCKNIETSIISKNLRSLQRGLTGDRKLIASSYLDQKRILQSYLLYYWPISFYEVSALLYELRKRGMLP